MNCFFIFSIVIFLLNIFTGIFGQKQFFVGAIFDEDEVNEQIAFRFAIEKSNINERSFELIPIIKVAIFDDGFMLEKITCELISNGVIAIFGSPTTRSGIIGQICHAVEIPHIIFDYKPEMPNYEKEFNTMSISVHPSDLEIANAYSSVVQSLSWDRYIILYENEMEFLQLQDVFQIHGPNNKPIVVRQLDDEGENLPLFKDIGEMKISFMIIHCSVDNIVLILEDLNELNMLGEYMSIFLAPIDVHTLDLGDLKLAKANITSIQIIDPSDFGIKNLVYEWEQRQKSEGKYFKIAPEEVKTSLLLISDAVMIFSKGLAESGVVDETIEVHNLDCKGDDQWPYGRKIIDTIKGKQWEGLTGRIDLDQNGQRSFFTVRIRELTPDGFEDLAIWDPVNSITEIGDEASSKRRDELLANKLFIVSSRIGAPFLFNRTLLYPNETHFGNDQFEGYSMDLIDEIAKLVGFKYEFKIAKDGKYGSYDKDTGKWNGIVREVMDGIADMGICDLTMTSLRRQVVDFTPPFMTLGISLMYAKPQEATSNLFSFIDPFSKEVWMKTGFAFAGLTFLVFISARMSPADWENPHPCEADPEELENAWNVKNSLWLTIGSLMGAGCDILPKSASVRIITGMWWFFALMMLNSYTANLAAFLTTSGTVQTIKSVEELANQNKIKYGTVLDGSTMGFFRDSNVSLYQKMWNSMVSEDPSVFVSSNDLGEERVVKSRRQYAFFMESSVLEYKIERNCDVLQVGSWLDYKTYGIAMPFNSRYRKEISEAVLKLGESGVLADLKRRWWKERHGGGQCSAASKSGGDAGGPTPLALKHVGGVFILLGMGILIGLLIAMLEFFWNIQTVSLQEKITLWDAVKLEGTFILKFWIMTKPVRSSGSGSSSSSKSKSLSPSESKEEKMNEKDEKEHEKKEEAEDKDDDETASIISMKEIKRDDKKTEIKVDCGKSDSKL